MRLLSLVLIFLLAYTVKASPFIEKAPIYGVIKPAAISTLIAVNNGMVSKIHQTVGDNVNFGQTTVSVIEKETIRGYRTTLKGQVAKIHVTPSAAVSPGMPLITIIDPNKKRLEVSLSPNEAQKVKRMTKVYFRGTAEEFGHISKVSPLVDPDTGAVITYIQPKKHVSQTIGDILPLDVAIREIENCKVVPIAEASMHLETHKVEATSGKEACLLPRDVASQ